MKTTHEVLYQSSGALEPIRSRSIDLVVTSPPYPMIEMWDGVFSMQNKNVAEALHKQQGPAAFERMHRVLDPVWKQLFRVLKSGGLCCINIGDAVRTVDGVFRLYPNHTRIIHSALKAGFQSLPCILWRKQTNAPNKFMGSGMLPAGAYVTLEHEYILVFRKGGKREFINADEKQRRRESAFFWEERNSWFSDVWMDLKGASQTLFSKAARDRSAAFPFELPYRLINMFSVKGDTVLDPFLGLGTTLFAAMASARNSIGVEISPEFSDDIGDSLPGVRKIADARIRQRIADHLAFVDMRKKQNKPFKHENIHYNLPVVTKQEKHLYFNMLKSVSISGEDRYEAVYSNAPDGALKAYWGDLFR